MHNGDDARKGNGDKDTAAQTLEHGATVASPTPTPLEQNPTVASPTPQNPVRDGGAIGAADTAVATRSQSMAAVAPPEEEVVDGLLETVLLGRYEITRKIGQGGMGAVYEATHKLIGKRVAVKVLLDKYAQKDQVVARLEQEARLASSIGHEHIIDITDFGQTNDGRTFVVMEFLEGESLGACLSRDGPMDEQRAIHVGHQIASALGAAHKKGVIHRDVKPENVFLLRRRDEDFVKVVDFGISKSMRPGEGAGAESPRLTQTGMVLGTPLYMSPEQARGDEDLDHRIDIYALGVILYEMVTGEVPFKGTNYLSIISQVINEDPAPPRDVRPELSEDLESVVMKALTKDLDARYQTMGELADDLAALRADDLGSTGRARITASRFRRTWKKRSGLRALGWVAGIAVVISAVVVTVSVWMSDGDKNGDKTATAAARIADASPPKPKPDAAAPQPPVEVVEIRLHSKPNGATVYHGDREIGTTPGSYKAPKANEKIELIAELDGHHDAKVVINPYVDTKAVFRLKKHKKGTKLRKLRKRGKGDKKGEKPASGDSTGKPDDTAGGDLTGNPYD